MSSRRVLAVGLATAGLAVPLVTTGGTAAADPSGGEVVALTCGGVTYQAAVSGNGEFTPAHDLASTKVFVPHAFGPATITIRDASGAVLDTFTESSGSVQGSGKQPNDLHCTYTLTAPLDDPSVPGGTFTVVGSVTGQATGR